MFGMTAKTLPGFSLFITNAARLRQYPNQKSFVQSIEFKLYQRLHKNWLDMVFHLALLSALDCQHSFQWCGPGNLSAKIILRQITLPLNKQRKNHNYDKYRKNVRKMIYKCQERKNVVIQKSIINNQPQWKKRVVMLLTSICIVRCTIKYSVYVGF